jgi:dUTP pyrophosphatase
MKIRIKRFDASFPLPQYHTKGAAAFDLASRKEISVPPRQVAYPPLNVAVAAPEGYALLLFARSSLHKRGLMLANGVGVIDPDYAGDDDELTAAVLNFTDAEVRIAAGDRIAQGIFVAVDRAEWEEVLHMELPKRGGFGTTGQ